MQLSTLVLSTLLASIANAAPVMVYVTETVVETVIVQGATQSVIDAYIPSPTTSLDTTSSSLLNVETTAIPTTAAAATSTEAAPTTTEAATIATTSEAATTTSEPTTTAEAATTTAATTSSTEAAATTTSAGSDFQSQILAEHNAKRALHGVDALTWDSTLESYAQNYADKYDCSGTLTHSGGQYGENLALGYTVTGSVDAWYSEGDNFDYSSCNVYDHFTQVIWKSTTKVGCGYKKCGDYWGSYIICSYDPAGNYVGECPANVLPLA